MRLQALAVVGVRPAAAMREGHFLPVGFVRLGPVAEPLVASRALVSDGLAQGDEGDELLVERAVHCADDGHAMTLHALFGLAPIMSCIKLGHRLALIGIPHRHVVDSTHDDVTWRR